MRFETVRAIAFGPFRDRELELAPGMTLLWGPNESGKSTWHAALFAGLCGLRRRPGRRNEDRAFAERHRPWDGEEWRVGAVVVLDDGRRIELSHDLVGLVDCRATDLGLGRDVSDEVMHDGSPDGARFLGLTRDTLAPTIHVRQADLLGVMAGSKTLQDALQRAAATGGTDDTAERALARITEFRSEAVGSQRSNSTKPLMTAVRAVEDAERVVREARAAHDRYLELAHEQEAAQRAATVADTELRRALALQARQRLHDAAERQRRATKLAALFPDGAPPPLDTDDEVSDRVAAALAAWDRAPDEPEQPEGTSAEELAGQIAALPQAPDGDVEVDLDVAKAREAWATATSLVEHAEAEAAEDEMDDVGQAPVPADATPTTLRETAALIDTPAKDVDPGLRARVEAARQPARDPARIVLLVVAAAGLLAGVGLALAQMVAAGVVLAVVGAAAGAVAVARGDRATEDRAAAQDETRLAFQEEAAEESRRQRARGIERAQAWGLPPDPTALRRFADEIESRERGAEARRQREQQLARRRQRRDEAAAGLAAALSARGAAEGDDVGKTYARYEEACRQAARQAADARRRQDLERQWEARRQLERRVEEDRTAHERASHGLIEVAVAAGVLDANASHEHPRQVAEALRSWQRRQRDDRKDRAEARSAWQQLETLLDGRSLEDLAEQHARLEREASAYADVEQASLEDLEHTDVGELERQQRAAEARLVGVEADMHSHARTIPSVPEAEEGLARAQGELERLRRLDATLDRAEKFLQSARERVHRSIAPQLVQSVRRRLPAVTAGRYDDVLIDPAELAVQVRDPQGRWREAHLLSHGTAEQVYLLLRVALAEHLVTTGETAPLVLDDPTVQSDRQRTGAVLDLLHELSLERQIVLFSQEDDVLGWAREKLTDPPDSVVELGDPTDRTTPARMAT